MDVFSTSITVIVGTCSPTWTTPFTFCQVGFRYARFTVLSPVNREFLSRNWIRLSVRKFERQWIRKACSRCASAYEVDVRPLLASFNVIIDFSSCRKRGATNQASDSMRDCGYRDVVIAARNLREQLCSILYRPVFVGEFEFRGRIANGERPCDYLTAGKPVGLAVRDFARAFNYTSETRGAQWI